MPRPSKLDAFKPVIDDILSTAANATKLWHFWRRQSGLTSPVLT
jgi:hypothetical protein